MKFEASPEEVASLHSLEKKDVELKKPVRTLEQLEEMAEGNEILEELLQEVLKQSIAYAGTVARYNQILKSGAEEGVMSKDLADLEPVRTTVHNATIDVINAFSRQLAKAGKDNTWVGEFGKNRAAYGKFALLLALNWIQNNPQ